MSTCGRTRCIPAAALVALALAMCCSTSFGQAADRQKLTLTGLVTKNPVAGYFVIRAQNGWTYRVDTRRFKPEGLALGDRVRVFGNWTSGVMEALNVRVLGHEVLRDAYNVHPNRTINGTVTSNPGGNSFVVRARNGWTYLVRGVWGEPEAISVGDRVRTFGHWRDGVLNASNIRLLYGSRADRNARNITAAGGTDTDVVVTTTSTRR